MSILRLAYIGDSVWDMLVRTRLILEGKNLHHMHQEAVSRVNAAAQSRAFHVLDPVLSDEERSFAMRGRNAHARHAAPKHQDRVDYQEATGLEALMGFLYLTGQEDRLHELFEYCCKEDSICRKPQ